MGCSQSKPDQKPAAAAQKKDVPVASPKQEVAEQPSAAPTGKARDIANETDAPTTESLKLLTSLKLGDLDLKNRVALAPLTRGRATEDFVPTDIMVEYYRQRANAGMVISEAAGISRQGASWWRAGAIFTEEQAAGWEPVIKAVHDEGSVFCMQLWHMGRASHSDVTTMPIVSASALPLSGEVTTVNGVKKPYETPVPLTVEGIKAVVQDYKRAAELSKKAGADLVEIHSANGYLLDQFLQTCSNKRTDEYGGSVENRMRFLSEVFDAVAEVYPANRIGVRLAPNGAFQEMGSEDNTETFTAVIKMLSEKKLGYLHVMDGLTFGYHEKCPPFTLKNAREALAGTAGESSTVLMGNCGYTRDTAEAAVQSGDGDMIAFGRPYISNPDLVARFAANAELNPDSEYADWWTKREADGYTTFPTLEEARKAKAEKEAAAAEEAKEEEAAAPAADVEPETA